MKDVRLGRIVRQNLVVGRVVRDSEESWMMMDVVSEDDGERF